MSKRTKTDSALENPKNFWPTPFSAAAPLARALPPATQYQELCGGDGRLIGSLFAFGHVCVHAVDLEPRSSMVGLGDGRFALPGVTIVTNPPFAWELLQPLLDAWVGRNETWLLLPWDMTCNLTMNQYARHIDRQLPLGRVSWLDNGKGGFENYGWFRFAVEPQDFVLPRQSKRITHSA